MAKVIFDHVTKRFGSHGPAVSELSLEVQDGEFMVVVGSSGCGKTTTLRMLAGLESATCGEISIGADVVNDWPTRDRDIAMVFQTHGLYPHLTVAQNLAFPLRVRGGRTRESSGLVRAVARNLSIESLLERRPAALSVGEQQRVAVGRAIIREPQVLLMDEPMSSLDAQVRIQTRSDVWALQRELGVTTLYVTHDQVEAMTMGDRVAVMRDGRLLQCAPPQQLFDRPASVEVAQTIGTPQMNVFRSTLFTDADGCRRLTFGDTSLVLDPQFVRANRHLKMLEDGHITVGLRPEAFSLALTDQVTNTVDVTVVASEMLGAESLLHFSSSMPLWSRTETIDAVVHGRRTDGEGPSPDQNTMCGRLTPPRRLSRGARARLTVDTNQCYLFDHNGVLYQ